MQKQIHLAELAGVDITTVNKEDLVDVSGLAFDNTIPREQRAAQVLRKVKNPYCFRVGDMGVKLEFLDSAPPLRIASPTSYNVKRAACNQCAGRLRRPLGEICNGSTTLLTPPIKGII